MVKIGLIADIQYADRDDRAYCLFRSTLGRLSHLVDLFNREGVDLVVQLGDVVDGHGPKAEQLERTRVDLDQVLEILGGLHAPCEHVIGNHCLSLPRRELHQRLGLERAQRVIHCGGERIALLDSLAVSLYDQELDPQGVSEAEAAMARRGDPDAPWAVDWNGALGQAQRAWLGEELRGENPPRLFLCHHPILPAAARARFLAWDHGEILELLRGASGGPITWVAGHDHRGGRAEDGADLHMTLRGLVGAPEVTGLECVRREGIELFVPRHPSVAG